MRGLTARGARPCLKNNQSVFSLPPIRRTSFPPLQRHITCADAFLILLPSVLTAALVVDFTGKERRRAEWDRQIAVAEEEASLLKQRQLDTWSRIQYRSVSHGAWQQRRSLYTASRVVHPIDQRQAQETDPASVDEEIEQEMDPLYRETEINQADSEAEIHADMTTNEFQNDHARFGRLLATRLALQLMMQLRSGRSLRYAPEITVDSSRDPIFKQSIDFIVQEMNKVHLLMQEIKIQEVPWDIHMTREYYERQEEMARRMKHISHQYRDMEIHLPDYLISFVRLVTEFKMAPPMKSYVLMMRTLAQNQQNSPMANYVEMAIFDSHEYLDSYTISNVLHRYGSNLDSVRMNEFFERITRSDNHPRARSIWYRTHVNDIDVCIPKSKDGHLMTALIRAALTNRQSTVAEAYASVFMDRDRIERYSGVHKWFVVSNFLTGYGKWGSWKTGKRWLETAVLWADEFAEASYHVLGRVIIRMLDFCVACGQREEYEMIMDAAIAASIPVPGIDPSALIKVSHRISQIRYDWIGRQRHAPVQTTTSASEVVPEQVRIFQSLLKGRYDNGQKLEEKPFHPSESDWVDDAPVPWNPTMAAARRLKDVAEHRQQSLNTGFKNHPPSYLSDSFPPAGPENSISQEPYDIDAEGETFASPFFQPVQNNTELDISSISDDPVDPSISEVERLKAELATANQRIQQVEEEKRRELIRLRRALEASHTKLRVLEHSTTLEETKDWGKASATG